MSKHKVLIIDGNNLAYRAYHKYKAMASKSGTKSSMVFGFSYILNSLIKTHKPKEVLVVFDNGRSKVRTKLLPGYKDRDKDKDGFDMDNFISQKKDTQKFLTYFGIAYTEHKNQEADDLIWLHSRKFKRQGKQVVIVSTDKDFNQLVSKDITIWNPFKKKMITQSNMKNMFGYLPKECVDYLILDGDKSDGIPGYPGVGPKTALKFIANYGSIHEYLYTYKDKEDSKIKRKQLEELYLLNRQLIDIRLFCRRHIKTKNFKISNPSKGKVNDKKIALLSADYSITTFNKKDFKKQFLKLL